MKWPTHKAEAAPCPAWRSSSSHEHFAPLTRKGVRIVNDDPRDVVAALKAKPGRDIWLFGGGELFRSLLTAGLVDTVEVGVMPVLLGSGIPLLPPGATTKLKLADQMTLPASGIVGLSYSIPGGSGPAPPHEQLPQAGKVPREEDGAHDQEEVDQEAKEEALSASARPCSIQSGIG